MHIYHDIAIPIDISVNYVYFRGVSPFQQDIGGEVTSTGVLYDFISFLIAHIGLKLRLSEFSH